MLTSDVSLLHDAAYAAIVGEYAKDLSKLSTDFAHAWYKLTSRDMGPIGRCVGNLVPPVEPWQHPLPPSPPPQQLADFTLVRDALTLAVNTPSGAMPPDEYNGLPTYGPLFVRLAWQCASTFRGTDYLGGCNGARIRHAPEKNWSVTKGSKNCCRRERMGGRVKGLRGRVQAWGMGGGGGGQRK